MVLLNSAKRSRYITTTVNQKQGGGSKKAGSPALIGKPYNIHERLSYESSHPLSFWRTNARPASRTATLPLNMTYGIKAR